MDGRRTKAVVAALALAGACGLVVVRRVLPALLERARFSDGVEIYRGAAGDPRVRLVVWEAPRVLAGCDSPARESQPALSPDGRWLAFAVGEPGLNAQILLAEYAGGVPRDPRPIASLETPFDELAPAFGPDGLYFASNRPGGAGGFDLYKASFDDGLVGAPEPLAHVNTAADELDPAPAPAAGAPAGIELVFASDRARGGRAGASLHVLRREASGALACAPLDAPGAAHAHDPSFSADGRTLLFARAAGGSLELWRTTHDGVRWLDPEPLEGLASAADERGPELSADGFQLLLERDGDLLVARSRELHRLPPEDPGWADLALLAALLLLGITALLARRWSQLDVLYKCLLASVLLHALIWWLLRDVRPESGLEAPRDPPGAPIRVQLASKREAARALEERGGSLARSERAAAPTEAPARLEALLEAAEPALSARVLEAAEAELMPAPAADAGLEPAPRATPEVAVQSPAEALERTPLPVRATPLAAASSFAPSEMELQPPAPAVAASSSGPGAAPRPLELEVPQAGLVGPQTRVPSLLQPQPRAVPAPDVAQPRESVARAPLEAGPAVPAPQAFATPPRASGAAPAREASELGTAVAQAPARPPATLGLELPGAALPKEPPVAPGVAKSNPALPVGPALEGPREERVRASEASAAAAPAPALESARSFERSRAAPAPVAPAPAAPSAAAPDVARRLEAPPRPLEMPALDQRAALPPAPSLERTPYRSRFGSEKSVALRAGGGGEDTERAVALGLQYLASIQRPDGSWGSPEHLDPKYGEVRVGKSALCLLAFLGAGHTPISGTLHADTAARAADFLLSVQDPDSGHFGDSSAYSHGIATYALAETFALTRAEVLRAPLQQALAHILDHQVTQGRASEIGGWSYYYRDERRFDAWARASISAWQVMALESARLGGLEVPQASLDLARRYLLGCQDETRQAFRYSHDPARLRSGYPTLPGSTPAALFALALLGEDITAERFAAARNFLMRRVPSGYRFAGEDAFVREGIGNLYFWYYGSLALFVAGGEAWQRWNVGLKETLLPAQREDGAWDPVDVYARYAGDSASDKSYTTAMCVLSLEVYYRYFTPLLHPR